MSIEIYCGSDDLSWVRDKHDPHIIVYGDDKNSTVTPAFIKKLGTSIDALNTLEFKQITRIEANALSNLQVSKFTLILPDTLEYIGEYAFQNCTAMNDIIIPSSVTYIGDYAFYDCASLNHIYFKEDIKIDYIPKYFCSGGGLNSVGILYNNGTKTDEHTTEFPRTVSEIKANAFYNCMSMGDKLIIGDNVKSIGDYAFYETLFSDITIGNGVNSGDNTESDKFEDGGYDTDRTVTVPYTLFLSSKRQFRYKYFEVEKDSDAGTIYIMNKKNYKENGKSYTYRTDDDDFKFCLQNSHVLVFKNGLLLPNTYYYLHSIINNPIDDTGIVFNVPLVKGDQIDIFYVTNDLKHMEVEYYDMDKKERYIQNGDIKISAHGNEYRVMGEGCPNCDNRTNYIKLRSPLYAISSKHSTFVFLNGKKVRLDELEDISDTIMSINTDYASEKNPTMNAIRLEVMNHLDTQDIIEQMYINDGLMHDMRSDNLPNTTFGIPKNNIKKNTLLLNHIDLTKLEAYAKRTLLDEILNDLSDDDLNRLFYDYNTAKGPRTPYKEDEIIKKYLSKDEVIPKIIDKYFIEEDKDHYIYDSQNTSLKGSGTLYYTGEKDKLKTPTSFDGNKTSAVLGGTYTDNKNLKKVIIPDGINRIG